MVHGLGRSVASVLFESSRWPVCDAPPAFDRRTRRQARAMACARSGRQGEEGDWDGHKQPGLVGNVMSHGGHHRFLTDRALVDGAARWYTPASPGFSSSVRGSLLPRRHRCVPVSWDRDYWNIKDTLATQRRQGLALILNPPDRSSRSSAPGRVGTSSAPPGSRASRSGAWAGIKG